MRSFHVFLASCFIPLASFCQELKVPFTKGVYGNPGVLINKGQSFKSLGINAVFVRSASLDIEIYQAAKADGVRVYVEFPTLNGKEYLADHPEAWPINEKGNRAPPADWFMGICPTDPGFRDYRVQELKAILQQYNVDGIWLDYLHWHAQFETPRPILPETCFCDRCINQFEHDTQIQVPPGGTLERASWILSRSDTSWRLWRSKILNGWVTHLKTVLKQIRPEAQLGIYYCPWYPDDFNEAQYRILGLDLKELAKIADVFSPMLYHHMMERPPLWVQEYTEWLGKHLLQKDRPLIWPIVQAENKPGKVSVQEFKQVLASGSRLPSSGVMMFSLHSLIDEPEKLEAMKQFYLSK